MFTGSRHVFLFGLERVDFGNVRAKPWRLAELTL